MSHTSSPSPVCVFAKAPKPGLVKTRLIPLLGPGGAAALHARLIQRTLGAARRAAPGNLELHADPADDDFLRYCAAHYRALLVQQSAGDVGVHMHNAFEQAFSRGCASMILMGTDCAVLEPRHVRLALRALAGGRDAVFLPAEDGGYMLVGLGRCDWRLFSDIAWSTEHVMTQTRDRLKMLGWRWLELDRVWDIDRPADYERLISNGIIRNVGEES